MIKCSFYVPNYTKHGSLHGSGALHHSPRSCPLLRWRPFVPDGPSQLIMRSTPDDMHDLISASIECVDFDIPCNFSFHVWLLSKLFTLTPDISTKDLIRNYVIYVFGCLWHSRRRGQLNATYWSHCGTTTLSCRPVLHLIRDVVHEVPTHRQGLKPIIY